MSYKIKTEWTTEQLINMSESIAQAYCPGLEELTVNHKRQKQNWKSFYFF